MDTDHPHIFLRWVWSSSRYEVGKHMTWLQRNWEMLVGVNGSLAKLTQVLLKSSACGCPLFRTSFLACWMLPVEQFNFSRDQINRSDKPVRRLISEIDFLRASRWTMVGFNSSDVSRGMVVKFRFEISHPAQVSIHSSPNLALFLWLFFRAIGTHSFHILFTLQAQCRSTTWAELTVSKRVDFLMCELAQAVGTIRCASTRRFCFTIQH